jgi:triosephosphate isomerase
MNPSSLGKAKELAAGIGKSSARERDVDVIVAPPFPFLETVGGIIKRAKLGAQNAFWEDKGPSTGEVSPLQLRSLGVSAVIIGHSERRRMCGETDEMIRKKTAAVLKNKLTAILCVGENERSDERMFRGIGMQLESALRGVSKKDTGNLVVAYEPVWAISTTPGSTPETPDGAFRALLYIRKTLVAIFGATPTQKIRIIYGGSVTSKNIADFLRGGKMEGALVGGASLDAREFADLLRAAGEAVKKP